MATEAVHRALALQASLATTASTRRSPSARTPSAVLESAGFGFGKPGSKPGTNDEYAAVAARTQTDPAVNTFSIA